MREISEFMEGTGKNYVKKFLLFYLIIFCISLFAYDHQISTNNSFATKGNYLFWMYYLCFAIHEMRFKDEAGKRSLTRIKLLPVSKMSYVYSQLLYVGATIIMIYVIHIQSWYVALMMNQSDSIISSLAYSFTHLDQVFYQSFFGAMRFDLPMYWPQVINILLLHIAITYAFVQMLVSLNEQRYLSIFLYMMAAFLGLILSASTKSHIEMLWVSMGLYSVVIIFSHYSLYKRFGRRVKIK